MIDWHSHVLPKMDDGSRSVEESVKLLNALRQQGVDTVIATPHFYANDESVERFLARREKAYELLADHLTEDMPRLLKGAEVRYYSGISRMKDLKSLRIENSQLLLLEMPFERWTEYTVRELNELSTFSEFRIILAHIERYLPFQDRKVLESVYDNDIFIQSNASNFIGLTSKRKALHSLENGKIHFIGSDCHNMSSRPPKIGKAFDIISKNEGNDFLTQMNEFGKSLLV